MKFSLFQTVKPHRFICFEMMPGRKSKPLMLCFFMVFLFAFTKPDGLAGPDWKLDTTAGNVNFYHALVVCNGKKVVLLKLMNRNGYKVTISWKEIFVTKQVKSFVEGARGRKEIVLSPGELYASDCESKNRSLVILPADISPAYEAEVEKFAFTDVHVTPLN